MREAVLFYSFIIIFIVTAAVTLLGVTGRISIPPTQLTMLLGAFLVEVAAAVIALYNRTDFFRPQSGKLAGSLGSAIEEFDKISDEISATLHNAAPDPTHFHGFLIRRTPAGVAAYQRMKVISSQQLEELPPAQKKLIRDYERAMKTLRQEWSHLKAGDGNFGADSSGVVAVRILKRKVNIAVCFHFCVNDAARKRIPFLLGWHPRFCVVRQVHIRP